MRSVADKLLLALAIAFRLPLAVYAQSGNEKPLAETTVLTGKVIDPRPVDPREQALVGALVHGDYNAELTGNERLNPAITKTVAGGTFQMRRVASPIILEAISADGKLSGIARVAADQADVTIRLGPLASARGRLVDRTGNPVTIGSLRYCIRLPEDWGPNSSLRQFALGVALFDADGRFTLSGLVPGQEYLLEYTNRGDWRNLVMTSVGRFTPTGVGGFQMDDLVVTSRDPIPHPPRPEGEARDRAIACQEKLFSFLQHVATGTDADFVVQRKVGVNFDDAIANSFAYWTIRMPGVKQADTWPTTLLVDSVKLPGNDATDVLVSGWQPKSPLFARLKMSPGGRELAWGDKNTAMLGAALAQQLHKKVGEEIELYGDKFKIVGVYESLLSEENSGLIVGLESLQRLMDRPEEVSAILITAEHPIDDAGLGALRGRIQAMQPGIEVNSVRSEKHDREAP